MSDDDRKDNDAASKSVRWPFAGIDVLAVDGPQV